MCSLTRGFLLLNGETLYNISTIIGSPCVRIVVLWDTVMFKCIWLESTETVFWFKDGFVIPVHCFSHLAMWHKLMACHVCSDPTHRSDRFTEFLLQNGSAKWRQLLIQLTEFLKVKSAFAHIIERSKPCVWKKENCKCCTWWCPSSLWTRHNVRCCKS